MHSQTIESPPIVAIPHEHIQPGEIVYSGPELPGDGAALPAFREISERPGTVILPQAADRDALSQNQGRSGGRTDPSTRSQTSGAQTNTDYNKDKPPRDDKK